MLDVFELKKPDGSVAARLAKLRNPWSSERYHGKWSDNDWRWTEDYKKQVGFNAADDGVFYMPYYNYRT